MLREQPSLSAWGRPAGWVPRPQVGRRPRLADTVEGLVRSHDPRRGLRTRPDHHLSQMKCGWLLLAFGVLDLPHATKAATSAPSRALPRRRALCTNWKNPR